MASEYLRHHPSVAQARELSRLFLPLGFVMQFFCFLQRKKETK